jgi:hypothetical protein
LNLIDSKHPEEQSHEPSFIKNMQEWPEDDAANF